MVIIKRSAVPYFYWGKLLFQKVQLTINYNTKIPSKSSPCTAFFQIPGDTVNWCGNCIFVSDQHGIRHVDVILSMIDIGAGVFTPKGWSQGTGWLARTVSRALYNIRTPYIGLWGGRRGYDPYNLDNFEAIRFSHILELFHTSFDNWQGFSLLATSVKGKSIVPSPLNIISDSESDCTGSEALGGSVMSIGRWWKTSQKPSDAIGEMLVIEFPGSIEEIDKSSNPWARKSTFKSSFGFMNGTQDLGGNQGKAMREAGHLWPGREAMQALLEVMRMTMRGVGGWVVQNWVVGHVSDG